jgi:hypothetical protein
MLSKPILNLMETEFACFCKNVGFDVAILFELKKEELKVLKIFGDHFARPDLTELHPIDRSAIIYQNENILAQENSDFSFIPTMGVGSDCGFRIKNSPYIITFDDVLGGFEVDAKGKKQLKIIQQKLEEKIK